MTNVLTQEIKDKYIARAKKHKKADAFIQGTYWKELEGVFKGCAVGCLAETGEVPHKKLSKDMKLPLWMFYLADRTFEALPSPNFKDWPLRFVSALPLGLTEKQINERVLVPFLIYVLEHALTSFDHDKFPDCKNAIESIIELYKSGETDPDKFKAAAAYATYAAADAADATYADAADADATYAAARAATYATAATATADATADATARAAAHATDAWRVFADKLIELMENANNE